MEQITGTQKIIALLAILLIGGGLLWQSGRKAETPQNSPVENPAKEEPADIPTFAADENAEDGVAASAPDDTSDAGLEQDLAAIDSQLNKLETDAGGIDSGINDQPIEQGQ